MPLPAITWAHWPITFNTWSLLTVIACLLVQAANTWSNWSCRVFCPLGSLYSLPAFAALLAAHLSTLPLFCYRSWHLCLSDLAVDPLHLLLTWQTPLCYTANCSYNECVCVSACMCAYLPVVSTEMFMGAAQCQWLSLLIRLPLVTFLFHPWRLSWFCSIEADNCLPCLDGCGAVLTGGWLMLIVCACVSCYYPASTYIYTPVGRPWIGCRSINYIQLDTLNCMQNW